MGRYPSSSTTRTLGVIHCASCHSSRFSAWARRSRVISVSRVRKSTRWPASIALIPSATANMVLPVPGGPSRIRFSARSTNASPASSRISLAVDRRLEAEVELLERLDVGKPCQPQPAFHALEPARLPLGHQRLTQELRVVSLAFGGLLAQGVELGRQMFELEFGAQLGQLHCATSSYTASSRRSTVKACSHRRR